MHGLFNFNSILGGILRVNKNNRPTLFLIFIIIYDRRCVWKGCGGEGIDNYQYFTSFSGRAWLSPQNSGPRIANTLSFVPLSIVQQGQNIQARL